MNVTLIDGTMLDSSDILFDLDNLNAGVSPVFTASDTGIVLDNLLKQADMDTLFTPEGWTFPQWNAWRAAHPYVATAYIAFQDQNNVPDTTVLGALADQNILATAGNYYLDAAKAAIQNNPALAIGVVVVGGLALIALLNLVRE